MAPKGGYEAAAAVPAAPSGGLVAFVADVMETAPEMPAEKSKEELAAMSKEERTAYHKTRTAAMKAKAAPKPELSKKDKAAAAREKQEADRKKKEDAKGAVDASAEALEELKLQGLTEDQAREVLNQMATTKTEDVAEDSDEEEETLLGSVKRWMTENDETETGADSMRDFNLKVRFQGHVDSTPPDHLECILQVMAAEQYNKLELSSVKQPAAVEKKIQPIMKRWAGLLGGLFKKCDVLDASERIAQGICTGVVTAAGDDVPAATRDVTVVGILMALLEEVEDISEEDLLPGCKKLDSDSKVMMGFITHLEEAAEGSDEESDD